VLDLLPPITFKENRQWRRKFARACDDLAGDLANGRWPIPRCTAEEMALHLALRWAPEELEGLQDGEDDDGDGHPASHLKLPEGPGDYGWGMCSEIFFQDHDVLVLFDAEMDGFEDPSNPSNQYAGASDLRPDAWFRAFNSGQPLRDPHRGFR
jgi:hypothetical protein